MHLGRDNHTFEDTTANADIASERTLLVDICFLHRVLWNSESETDILVIANSLASFLSLSLLGVKEDSGLLLECFLYLNVGHLFLDEIY